MLQQFTWQQFLVATLVLTLIWYLGIILIFYRKEFSTFFKARAQTGKTEHEPLPHRWEKNVDEIGTEEEGHVMGQAKLPIGMEIVGSGDFGFASDGEKADQIGLVPDVLQEIKEVFKKLAIQDGSKSDFFKLMGQVRENYPKISGNPNLMRINEFITDHAPFHLSSEELESLWD